jgi:formylglycine-generating enzyme required for sulfatase activity
VLAECATSRSGYIPTVLAEAGESARLDQLDCEKDCAFWSEAEVKRVDACFPRYTCSDYRACLADAKEPGHKGPQATRERSSDGAAMVFVPAGPFVVGQPELAREHDERAAGTVELPDYWIDRDEVTVERYTKCVDARSCPLPDVDDLTPPEDAGTDGVPFRLRQGCNWKVAGRERHPVNCLTQYAAGAYCKFVGGRLPSELEWEKAARGPAGRPYPWGLVTPGCTIAHLDPESSIRTRGCGTRHTAEAASFPGGESPYGVRQMAGNVWEWVAGHYDRSRYSDPADEGKAPDRITEYGVLRGGGWGRDASSPNGRDTHSEGLDAANRFKMHKRVILEGVGFRCVMEGGR